MYGRRTRKPRRTVGGGHGLTVDDHLLLDHLLLSGTGDPDDGHSGDQRGYHTRPPG
ncbi:hypothetical protein ACIBHX_34735 [Nonomuraea sp. NPDC050536]|uniref:hypothetical protein n=1 Tax=Nonomuraea sp. NPDC050536 TaxID=3364366 RepID=UPI0037C5BCCB